MAGGSWSWIIGMDGSTNYKEQLRYIDFSAAMGYQSVLVDALWDKQIGRDKIEELAKYGKNKGVALYLWYNSNGYWNDAPQTPRSIMDNAIARRKEMKWMQSIGIRGIKVDFFGGDKQMTMQLYEDILSDANEYGLLVIFMDALCLVAGNVCILTSHRVRLYWLVKIFISLKAAVIMRPLMLPYIRLSVTR